MSSPVDLVNADGSPMRRGAIGGFGGGAWHAGNFQSGAFEAWNPGSFSADAANVNDRDVIADRAHDLYRNVPLVAGWVETQKNQAIGWGLEFQSMPPAAALGLTPAKARDVSAAIEEIWREWSEDPIACDAAGQNDFGGMTRHQSGGVLVTGECLDLALWLPQRQARRGRRFATVFQTVDAARLSSPLSAAWSENMRDGVEIDDFGAPKAYLIKKNHPGDLWRRGGETWERVPAYDAAGRRRVIHVFDQKRPDEHRGVSWLAPVMETIKQDARYRSAELQGALVNAMIAAVLETPLDGVTLKDLFMDPNFQKNWGSHGNVRLGLNPGGYIPELRPGESLKTYASSRPSAGFRDFTKTVSGHVARGLGGNYVTLTGDYEAVNYSSARAAMLEAWRSILNFRMLMTIKRCRPALELILWEAVARGYIDLPGFLDDPRARRLWTRGVWRGPARGWVDPVKEITAAVMRIRAGLSTIRDEALEQGGDFDALIDQIAAEREALRQRGIDLPEIDFAAAAQTAANSKD